MVLGGFALCWDGALLSIFYFGYRAFFTSAINIHYVDEQNECSKSCCT